ncbi:MAG TPA: c(7)-type cytochrome triheme domain-containing protein [Nitrospirota bacterium]
MKIITVFCFAFCMTLPLPAVGNQVGGGDLVFTPGGTHRVVFSHEMHINEKGQRCSGCHYHVFQMTKGAARISMNKMTNGDFCGRCHNGQKAFGVNDSKACSRCHKETTKAAVGDR